MPKRATHTERMKSGWRRGVVVAVLAVLVIALCVGLQTTMRTHRATRNVQPSTEQQATGTIPFAKTPNQLQPSDIDVHDLLNRTNQARQQAGLGAVTAAVELDNSAAAKCVDMVAKNYWAHNDPDGVEPWHFISEAGIAYVYAGENLADNYDDSASVFTGWMNSEEHKANILDGHFGRVGFAVCKTGDNFPLAKAVSLLVVQHFTD